jgi:hypothetical protein
MCLTRKDILLIPDQILVNDLKHKEMTGNAVDSHIIVGSNPITHFILITQ